MSSFLQGAAFVIEAVCEELEVLSLEMAEEREFLYLLPKTIRLQYCRGNGINHISGEKGPFETRW